MEHGQRTMEHFSVPQWWNIMEMCIRGKNSRCGRTAVTASSSMAMKTSGRKGVSKAWSLNNAAVEKALPMKNHYGD